jgi:hypothetical protein
MEGTGGAVAAAACAAATLCACSAARADGGEDSGIEVQPGLFISNPEMTLADDATLAATCECPREVYIEGEESLRKAFAPATIVSILSGDAPFARYADGTCKYSAGMLEEGHSAPDFDVLEVCRGQGIDLFSTGHLRPTTLLGPLRAAGVAGLPRKHLCLDFGSFS